ncbi:MAG: DUF2934 domain-containing protein [Thermoguttaceae bacterium]|jgi:hypothetical protein
MAAQPPTMDFDELKKRSLEIRALLASYKPKIKLKPGEGLEQTLAEAEAIADAVKKGEKGTTQAFVESAKAASVIWNLAETLKPCLEAGLDVYGHLKEMNAGSVDYGKPALGGGRKPIHFKDFEMELFAAAQCCKRKLPVKLNEVLNDPRGDLFIQPLRLSVKHPDRPNKLANNVRDFNIKLKNEGRYGVFVVGLEDAFDLEPHKIFKDDAEWSEWLRAKANDVEAYGKTFLRYAATLKRVLATVQTWTIWRPVRGELNLHRQSNAILFDDREGVPTDAYEMAAQVTSVFNPSYRRWSSIKAKVMEFVSVREREILRQSVQERAYQIWEEEGHPENRAWAHWFQAKAELGLTESDYI